MKNVCATANILLFWLPILSSTTEREIVHGSFPAMMEDHDIRRVIRDFARSALRARAGDLDGVEVSCQAATLIEQIKDE